MAFYLKLDSNSLNTLFHFNLNDPWSLLKWDYADFAGPLEIRGFYVTYSLHVSIEPNTFKEIIFANSMLAHDVVKGRSRFDDFADSPIHQPA